MTEQASRIDIECTHCGAPCEGWVIQMIVESRLRWEAEWACNRCGNTHDGDWGTAPDFIRSAIVAEHGKYRVRVTEGGASKGKVLKVFRDAFGCSIEDAKAFSEAAHVDGYVGTYIEASLVKQLLRRYGVDSSIERHGAHP